MPGCSYQRNSSEAEPQCTNFQPERTKEGRLEERLGAAEPLVADGDDLSVGELVALLEGGR